MFCGEWRSVKCYPPPEARFVSRQRIRGPKPQPSTPQRRQLQELPPQRRKCQLHERPKHAGRTLSPPPTAGPARVQPGSCSHPTMRPTVLTQQRRRKACFCARKCSTRPTYRMHVPHARTACTPACMHAPAAARPLARHRCAAAHALAPMRPSTRARTPPRQHDKHTRAHALESARLGSARPQRRSRSSEVVAPEVAVAVVAGLVQLSEVDLQGSSTGRSGRKQPGGGAVNAIRRAATQCRTPAPPPHHARARSRPHKSHACMHAQPRGQAPQHSLRSLRRFTAALQRHCVSLTW